MQGAKSWILRGRYFETCNCEAGCPCLCVITSHLTIVAKLKNHPYQDDDKNWQFS